jgi:hypothetical protein
MEIEIETIFKYYYQLFYWTSVMNKYCQNTTKIKSGTIITVCWVDILLCFRNVPNSNLGAVTVYLEEGFSPALGKCKVVTSVKLLQFPSSVLTN